MTADAAPGACPPQVAWPGTTDRSPGPLVGGRRPQVRV